MDARASRGHAPGTAVRDLGRADYEPVWRAMQEFTRTRGEATPDELWFVEHPPVFTLGLAANPGHVLDAGPIPVVQSIVVARSPGTARASSWPTCCST